MISVIGMATGGVEGCGKMVFDVAYSVTFLCDSCLAMVPILCRLLNIVCSVVFRVSINDLLLNMLALVVPHIPVVTESLSAPLRYGTLLVIAVYCIVQVHR